MVCAGNRGWFESYVSGRHMERWVFQGCNKFAGMQNSIWSTSKSEIESKFDCKSDNSRKCENAESFFSQQWTILFFSFLLNLWISLGMKHIADFKSMEIYVNCETSNATIAIVIALIIDDFAMELSAWLNENLIGMPKNFRGRFFNLLRAASTSASLS